MNHCSAAQCAPLSTQTEFIKYEETTSETRSAKMLQPESWEAGRQAGKHKRMQAGTRRTGGSALWQAGREAAKQAGGLAGWQTCWRGERKGEREVEREGGREGIGQAYKQAGRQTGWEAGTQARRQAGRHARTHARMQARRLAGRQAAYLPTLHPLARLSLQFLVLLRVRPSLQPA